MYSETIMFNSVIDDISIIGWLDLSHFLVPDLDNHLNAISKYSKIIPFAPKIRCKLKNVSI